MMDPAKKTRLEQYGVIALVVVFAFTLSGSLRGKGARRAHPPKPAVQVQQTNASKSLPTVFQERWKQLEQQVNRLQSKAQPISRAQGTPSYTAHALRDPLKSLLPEAPSRPKELLQEPLNDQIATDTPALAPPPLTVQGVLWGGPRPSAIINGEVYGVGATVDGATITSIGRNGVEVDFGGNKIHLTTIPGSGRNTGSQAAHWEGR